MHTIKSECFDFDTDQAGASTIKESFTECIDFGITGNAGGHWSRGGSAAVWPSGSSSGRP